MIIFRTSTTTNFAQGIISALGAFISANLFKSLHVPVIPAILCGMAVAFGLGIFIDSFIIKKAKNINAIGKQMITMGLVLLLIGLIPLTLQYDQPRIDPIVPGNLTWVMFGESFTIPWHSVITTLLAIVLISGLFVALRFTKWGLAVRATASNEKVAGMMGVNTHFISALSWAIAGALGSLAASLYSATIIMDSSLFMTPIQVQGFMASILGGFGTFQGPIVGALLITFSGNLLAIGGETLSLYKDVIVYVLILIVMLIKPLGLFGKKVIKKV